jgi:hypothetical protein
VKKKVVDSIFRFSFWLKTGKFDRHSTASLGWLVAATLRFHIDRAAGPDRRCISYIDPMTPGDEWKHAQVD